ncbi:MAG: IPT/TIG domain-containing protein [Acidobacteria bacterium]|nr:IPT/TIG domain-containing protein [Acidobacteriota bacterium]
MSITITAPAPTLASVSPNQGAQGSVTPVTFTGTNFIAPVTLNITGTVGLTASNVVLVNSQTITADLTSAAGAAIGNRLISITTPGGTSGTQWFKIVGLPSITSISPASGARGTIVSVTLQGAQFQGGHVAISGTGVTITNVLILNNGTTITMKLNIAAGAPVGPRDVTVWNAAGTSNAVTFTVN